jgi:hypothetical protein
MTSADPSFSQLFVARSKRICNYVRETVGDYSASEGVGTRLDYFTFEKLKDLCEVTLRGVNPAFKDLSTRVDFARFKREFPSLVSDSGLDPLVVWTQIRSSIKGSIHAVMAGRPLTLEEYLDPNVIGARRCRLTSEQREAAYKAFLVYQNHGEALGLWDDCDRVNSLLRLDYDSMELCYSRIYVDEIQVRHRLFSNVGSYCSSRMLETTHIYD